MSEERYVKHSGDGSDFTLAHAFRCAWEGVCSSFATQRNYRIHTAFAAAAILLGFILAIPAWGWVAIVACIAAVFAFETLNTAIEAVVDLVSPEWDRLAKIAKDCSAGAVLIVSIASVAIAFIVYIPSILELIA